MSCMSKIGFLWISPVHFSTTYTWLSAHHFFLQDFTLNTYRAAVRISHGAGFTWGESHRRERAKSKTGKQTCVECSARGGLMSQMRKWGKTKDKMHNSFIGVLVLWRRWCLRIVQKWEHLPGWRKVWADMAGSRCQVLETRDHCWTPLPLVFKTYLLVPQGLVKPTSSCQQT